MKLHEKNKVTSPCTKLKILPFEHHLSFLSSQLMTGLSHEHLLVLIIFMLHAQHFTWQS